MDHFCLCLDPPGPVLILAKWARQKDELGVMLLEPALEISDQAGLEAGWGSWKGLLDCGGNAYCLELRYELDELDESQL